MVAVRTFTAIEMSDEPFEPYMILGVERPLLLDTFPTGKKSRAIKKAWRKAALQTHPDKGGDAQIFQRIELAYRTLTERQMFNNWVEYGHPDGQPSVFSYATPATAIILAFCFASFYMIVSLFRCLVSASSGAKRRTDFAKAVISAFKTILQAPLDPKTPKRKAQKNRSGPNIRYWPGGRPKKSTPRTQTERERGDERAP